jgi:hypothetical protein
MSIADPFQVPGPSDPDYWKTLARRNEKRARRSHHMLVKIREEIDGLLERDDPPHQEAS